jgi:hypothetical protein
MGRSLAQRSPTVCSVSKRDFETSKKRRPWPIRAAEPQKEYRGYYKMFASPSCVWCISNCADSYSFA